MATHLINFGNVVQIHDYYTFKYVSINFADKYLFIPQLGGTKGPNIIKSYCDSKGGLNQVYISMLKRKYLAMIMKSPGITEESIIQQSNPMVEYTVVKDILSALEIDTLIYTKASVKTTVSLFGSTSQNTTAYFASTKALCMPNKVVTT